MTSGFDANVPARKPRTRLSRVISELTSETPDSVETREDRSGVEDPAAPRHEAAADTRTTSHTDRSIDSHESVAPDAPVAADAPAARTAEPSTAPPKETTTAASPAVSGREQIARLRERLAATDHAWSTAAEPKRTATAVRETVTGLRERMEASLRERSELADALEEARAALARTDADLQKERQAREALEAQAEERRRIADDAVAEAEALAAERDQVLGELAEHRRVEEEQTNLLGEVETALSKRDAERKAAARELAEARDLVDLRAAEVADLEARLEDEAAGRSRAESKCRELEAEITRLSEAREALESIEATLGYRRENQGDDTP
ncbi:MAG: hypothetical protein U5R46_01520 [Gammaproteobacteria bacterium]|nr:hypothetical protein [Gammaproteobacteria bacterium]